MFKCTECGHIFDDGEQKTYAEHHPYGSTTADEYFSVCPICGGDYEEAEPCKHCGGAFLEDELFGWLYCEECLREALTFNNFLEFAEYSDENLGESELHTVEHFMLVWVYSVNDGAISGSSKEFRELMMEEFKKAAEAHERAVKFGTDDKFIEQIWDYMKDYKLLDEFAEWLYDKEVKK